MFRGRYQHTLDPKGRVSVPSKYRNALAQFQEPGLIVVPNGEALEVHPLGEWERLEAKINSNPTFDAEIRKIGRLYISRAKEVDMDGAGRILLPPDSRAACGLEKDVTLVGSGRTYFEIWDRKKFEEYELRNGDGLPAGFDRLAQLGV